MKIKVFSLLTLLIFCCCFTQSAFAVKELNELVVRLMNPQPVEASRPEKTAKALKECTDRGYVHIMFKRTGTELGIELDIASCDFSKAYFAISTGRVHLVGYVTLNYDKCRCIVDIDLATCEGIGYLEPLNK